MKKVDINCLGGVVGWLSSNDWELSSWVGETTTVWAKFNKPTKGQSIKPMTDEIIEAYKYESDDDDVNDDLIAVICFKKNN